MKKIPEKIKKTKQKKKKRPETTTKKTTHNHTHKKAFLCTPSHLSKQKKAKSFLKKG